LFLSIHGRASRIFQAVRVLHLRNRQGRKVMIGLSKGHPYLIGYPAFTAKIRKWRFKGFIIHGHPLP
jgi:hypothetical protein